MARLLEMAAAAAAAQQVLLAGALQLGRHQGLQQRLSPA
jgi:hypothetical protein